MVLLLADPKYESRVEKPNPVYVPRDETFEEIKMQNMSAGRLKALLHNIVPLIKEKLASSNRNFACFSEIEDLYKDAGSLNSSDFDDEPVEIRNLWTILKNAIDIQAPLKYDLPLIISSKWKNFFYRKFK